MCVCWGKGGGCYRPVVYIKVFIYIKFQLNGEIYFESQKFGQSRRGGDLTLLSVILLRINKFLEISPSTSFQARAVTGRLLCLQRRYISR